ncbi:MAG TPA: heme-binding protein [Gemmatimonadales bacterium]|nr:heme-binding protein [Gemmatimonadales bacterium]
MRRLHQLSVVALSTLTFVGCSDNGPTDPAVQAGSLVQHLPDHNTLRGQLRAVLEEQNGGLGFEMWATILDRNGKVVDVVFSGTERGDQWPGSRVISAQKANTANAFSLEGFALSTANLYAAVQPGGSLFGLQESNPVDPRVAYAGPVSAYGTAHDPMIGRKIGGINVFGGGLALYSAEGTLLGGLGVSGDTSCTDHIIGWKLRHALNLDNVPAGPDEDSGTDNIIYQEDELNGFEHPICFDGDGQGNHIDIGNALPDTHPVGPDE